MDKNTFYYNAIHSAIVIVLLFGGSCGYTYLAMNVFSGSGSVWCLIFGGIMGFACGWCIGELADDIKTYIKAKKQ